MTQKLSVVCVSFCNFVREQYSGKRYIYYVYHFSTIIPILKYISIIKQYVFKMYYVRITFIRACGENNAEQVNYQLF